MKHYHSLPVNLSESQIEAAKTCGKIVEASIESMQGCLDGPAWYTSRTLMPERGAIIVRVRGNFCDTGALSALLLIQQLGLSLIESCYYEALDSTSFLINLVGGGTK